MEKKKNLTQMDKMILFKPQVEKVILSQTVYYNYLFLILQKGQEQERVGLWNFFRVNFIFLG